jgi:type IV conjugative transfer system protein TraE
MTPDHAISQLKIVGRQRNVALVLLLVALISIVILSLSVTAKKDQLVLVPLTSQPMTVEAGKVRRDYLRETAITISYFFENITPESADYFEERILSVTHPSARGRISADLRETVERWKDGSSSRAWYPRDVYEDPKSLYVEVTGELRTFVGTKLVDQRQMTLAMQFFQEDYSLYLQNIEELTPQEGLGARMRAEVVADAN